MLEEKGAGRTKMRQTEITDIQTVGESERESEREREREREREKAKARNRVYFLAYMQLIHILILLTVWLGPIHLHMTYIYLDTMMRYST